MPIVIKILSAVHVLVSLLIILLVLMQRPKSEGLGAAFGGGMTDNLFGAQSTNVLQTITRWLGGLFFALALGLSLLAVKATQKNSIQQQLMNAAAVPKTPATPATPTTPEGDAEKKLQEEIQKILEKQGTVPPPADGTPATPTTPTTPALPEGTAPPAKPEAPTPEAATAPVSVPDAKPAAPASVPAAPATPVKRPKTPPK